MSKTTQTKFFTSDEPLELFKGGSLAPITQAYETYGELSPAKDNAILIFHALSGSQHAAGVNADISGIDYGNEDSHEGWWDDFIGPGKALNTDKFFVICANLLGGCYGTTGPSSIDPATGKPYGSTFPALTFADIIDAQVRLLDHLGIDQLHAVVGPSIGGMAALTLAVRYPERTRIVIPVSTGMGTTSLNKIHNLEQIQAIEQDPFFKGGDYYDSEPPRDGLALARMIAHKTYISLSTIEMRARREIVNPSDGFSFYHLQHPIESYMLHQGQKFVKRFDANTYLRILGAWQAFNLSEYAGTETRKAAFARCAHQRYMVFSIDSDVCFYSGEQAQLVNKLKQVEIPCRYVTVHSEKGHDAFLLEPDLFTPHLAYSLEVDW